MQSVLWAAASLAIVFLAGKIYFLKKSAREIAQKLSGLLAEDTNVLIDIPSRDRAMRELAAALNRELRVLRGKRQRYQQGDLELKEAVTNVSHDLRTPLTAICGYLELLKKEEKSPQAEQYLAVIEERAQAMRGLTQELLQYSIVKSAKKELAMEPVVLNHALEESLAANYSLIAKRGIVPEILMPEKKVERILNRDALARVFQNILGNAVRYSDGDLRIVLKEDGELIFSNHAGRMNELQAAQIFGRFYTVDTAQDSTGLGLSIAQTLVEQMGGRISARWKEGVLFLHVSFPV